MMWFFVVVILFSLVKSKKHDDNLPPISNESDEVSNLNTDKIKTTVMANNGFIRKYFGLEFAFGREQLNMVASPIAAILPLGKMLLGVKKDSKTENELLDAVGLSSRAEVPESFKLMIDGLRTFKGGNLSVISKIYLKKYKREVITSFKDKANKIFGSSVQLIDTNNMGDTIEILNAWISKHTENLIKGVIESSDLAGRLSWSLILINTVYFRGIWKHAFDKTIYKPFLCESGQMVNSIMMVHSGSYNYGTSEELSAQILEIPFNDKNAAMIVLLPYTKKGLSFLMRTLKSSPDILNDILKNMKKTDVSVTLPKFGITATIDLLKYYKKMGLLNVGIPYIVRDESLYISRAKQRIILRVDNDAGRVPGNEYAQLPIEVLKFLREPKTIDFIADHPFMFYIKINNDQLLTGVVNQP